MLVHIKEIIKKKNDGFSQHFCTNVFTAVADLQVHIYKCTYDVNNIKGDYVVTFSRLKYITNEIHEHL
jgi:hypothetical protein